MPENNQDPLPAFFIDTAPLKWPVRVRMPVSGGTFANFEFAGLFARLSGEEIDKLAGIEQLKKDIDAASKDKNVERLNEINREILRNQTSQIPALLIGWEGVKTADGADVPFTLAVLQSQLKSANGEALAKGVWEAVAEIRHGYRLGNSAPLLAPGRSSAPAETEEPAF